MILSQSASNGKMGTEGQHVSANDLTAKLAYELGRLPAEEIAARVDELNELELTIGKRVYRDVRLIRCFPLSNEDRYIAVVGPDQEEIGIIEDLAACRPEVRHTLLDMLNTAYLVPQIIRVNNITTRGYLPVWDVETDRGHKVLELHSRRETYLIGMQVVIRDADGNRYEIEDYTKLDRRSQRLVEREV